MMQLKQYTYPKYSNREGRRSRANSRREASTLALSAFFLASASLVATAEPLSEGDFAREAEEDLERLELLLRGERREGVAGSASSPPLPLLALSAARRLSPSATL